MLSCPFCGAPETDRFDLEGQRFLVFRCLFTPSVDPSVPDDALAAHLATAYGRPGSDYFRKMCDRLHVYVVKGEGGRQLTAAPSTSTPPPETADG